MSDEEPTTDAAEAGTPTTRQWPYVVKLKCPVEYGDETITTLTFRRGRVGDMKGMVLKQDPPAEDLMLIASRMCVRPLKVIESLDVVEDGEALSIALDFYVNYAKAVAGKKR